MVSKRQNYVSPNLDVYDLVEEDIVTASDLGERVIDPWDDWEKGLWTE